MITKLLSVVVWVVANFNRKNWLWIRNGSGASLLFLAGLLNSQKLSDLLPGVLPDIALDTYINLHFWGHVARWDGFVLLCSVIVLFWLKEEPPVAKA